MAPKSPKRVTPVITAKRAETPRDERARRRDDGRAADEDDDANSTAWPEQRCRCSS